MRRRTLVLLSILFAVLLGAPVTATATERPDTLATSVEIHVIAGDPEQSGIALAEFADENGGYYTLRSLDQVVLRVPPDLLPAIRDLNRHSDKTRKIIAER